MKEKASNSASVKVCVAHEEPDELGIQMEEDFGVDEHPEIESTAERGQFRGGWGLEQ